MDTTKSPDSSPTLNELTQNSIDQNQLNSADMDNLDGNLEKEAAQENLRFDTDSRNQNSTSSQEILDFKDASLGPAGDLEEIPDSSKGYRGEIRLGNDPKNASEWNELGNIYLKAGAHDKAIAAYIKAIEITPAFGWPYSNLALTYCHKGLYADAIPFYQRSIELLDNAHEKAISWNRLGDAYRRLKDNDKAKAAYQMAADLDANKNSLLARARLSLLGNRSG
jgi:tetratricopeptide (TPR) repeat protein